MTSETSLSEKGVLNPNYTAGFSQKSYTCKRKKREDNSEILSLENNDDEEPCVRVEPHPNSTFKLGFKQKETCTKNCKIVGYLILVVLLSGLSAFIGNLVALKIQIPHLEVTEVSADESPTDIVEEEALMPQRVCPLSSNTTPDVFPDLDYAAFGYNYLFGYPLSEAHDPGLTHPIFTVTYNGNKKSVDSSYRVPDGFDIFRDVSCDTSFTSDVITRSSEFLNIISHSLQAHFRVFGLNLTANAEYRSEISEISSYNYVYITSQAKCQQFYVQLNAFNPPPFHPTFLGWVGKLQNTTDDRDYLDFLSYYGTHFITEAAFGASYMQFYKMENETYNTLKNKNINVGAQASLSFLFFKNPNSYNFTKKQKDEFNEFQSKVSTRFITRGNPPPYDFNVTTWAQKAFTTPVPISNNVMPIDLLFTDMYMSHLPAEHDVDYDSIRENLLHIMAIKYPREIFDRSTNIQCRSLRNPFKLPDTFCFDTPQYHSNASSMRLRRSANHANNEIRDCTSYCLEKSDCLGAMFGTSRAKRSTKPECHVLFRPSYNSNEAVTIPTTDKKQECYLFPDRLSTNYGRSDQPEWFRLKGVTVSAASNWMYKGLCNRDECETKCVEKEACVAIIVLAGYKDVCKLFTQSQIETAQLSRSQDEGNILAFVKVC